MSLIDFAGKLLQDPAVAQNFLADPQSALQAAGLDGVTPDDVRAVLPGVGDAIPSDHPLQSFIEPAADGNVFQLQPGDEAIPGIAGMVVRHADGSVTDVGTDTVLVPHGEVPVPSAGAGHSAGIFPGEDDWRYLQPNPDPEQDENYHGGDGSVVIPDNSAGIDPGYAPNDDDSGLMLDGSGPGAPPWVTGEDTVIDPGSSSAGGLFPVGTEFGGTNVAQEQYAYPSSDGAVNPDIERALHDAGGYDAGGYDKGLSPVPGGEVGDGPSQVQADLNKPSIFGDDSSTPVEQVHELFGEDSSTPVEEVHELFGEDSSTPVEEVHELFGEDSSTPIEQTHELFMPDDDAPVGI